MQTPPNYTQYPRGFHRPSLNLDFLGEAFQIFTKNAGVWIVAALVPAVISTLATILNFGTSFAQSFSNSASSNLNLTTFLAANALILVLSVVGGIVQTIVFGGLVKMALATLRNEPIAAGDVFRLDGLGGNFFITCFLVNLCVGVVAAVTCCFLGLPGIIVNGLLMLSMPFVIADRLGPVEAMQASWATLKPQLWAATGVYFILSLVVGLLTATGIGTIIAQPILAISLAIIFRDQVALPRQQSSTGR